MGLPLALATTVEQHSFPGLELPIPDGNGSGLSSVQTISSRIISLSSLRLKLRVSGEFNGDLYGYLRHVQNGTTRFCVLLNRVGRTADNPSGSPDSGFDVTFEDTAANGNIHVYRTVVTPPAGSPLTGTWQPDGRNIDPAEVLDSTPITTGLSSFNGTDPNGEWTLFLADIASGGTHVLERWDLEFTGEVLTPYIFYNQSVWDGGNAAANASDDNAIAPDKVALRPGGKAAFANYTSYSRGINGIMIDLRLKGVPTDADFTFKVGNTDDPSTWATAPAPLSITFRAAAGLAGSDRVTIIWADSAISKQWLQVTVKATEATGLAADETFYFGNAIGEVGNSLNDAQVNSTDVNLTRMNPRFSINPAEIDNLYDFNRDKLVNSTDINLARMHTTFSVNALRLITPSQATGLLSALPNSGAPALSAARSRASAMGRSAGKNVRLEIGHDLSGALVLTVHGEQDLIYQLEFCDDLGRGNWAEALEPARSDSGPMTWRVTVARNQPQRYFRVRAWSAEQ